MRSFFMVIRRPFYELPANNTSPEVRFGRKLQRTFHEKYCMPRHFRQWQERLFPKAISLEGGSSPWPKWPRAHVHGGTIISGNVPGFRSAEPITLRFVAGVIEAPGGTVSFVLQPVAEHERCNSKGSAGPHFFHLLVGLDQGAVRSNAVNRPHGTVGKFHDVEGIDFFQ